MIVTLGILRTYIPNFYLKIDYYLETAKGYFYSELN